MSEAPEEKPSDDWYLNGSTRAQRLARLGTRPEAGRERVENTGPWLTSAELAGCLSGKFVGSKKPPK